VPKLSKSMPEIGRREDTVLEPSYRRLSVSASSLNEQARTISAIIATETPVLMPDFQRMEMIPEVLLLSGAEIPESRQVPLLDSHNRKSVVDQLGSAREIQVTSEGMVGVLHFSEEANKQFTKVREGHVTDVSAGYRILKRVFVRAGETKTISGRSFEGPVHVVTKWRLDEVSLTPIGADAQAKLRGLDPAAIRFESQKGQFEMNPELRALLVSRGMAATLTDDEAQSWLLKNARALADEKKIEDKESGSGTRDSKDDLSAASIAKMIGEATRAAIAEERTRTAAFQKEVDSLCELAGLPDEAAACRSLPDVAAVRSHLLTARKTATETIGMAPSVRITGEGADRFMQDIQWSLTNRALSEVATPAPLGVSGMDDVQKRREMALERVFPKANKPKGAEQWNTASMYDIAEEMVRSVYGVVTRGMSRQDVATIALFGPETARNLGLSFRSSGAAYHNTASFANLTLDAQNKSMMLGYTEAPSTWEGPMKRGASVPDFKNVHRMRLGSIPNLPVWNDNKDPEKASLADAKETYAVESRSLELDFSYRLLINDDMGVLGPAPAQLGAAARRTVNAFAWSLITSNPTMGDGQALFLETAAGNRKRSNLTTGSATPTNATLQTMKNKMRQMRGENTPEGNESADILNLQARYIVGPGALDTTILQLVLSVADPVSQLSSAVYNPANTLIPVIEPLLDVASTTAWYLFADPSQIDTAEVSFLNGQETPVVRMAPDYKKLSQSTIILQTFGGSPMNHRGIQKHNGA
jgi:hypothetical protein